MTSKTKAMTLRLPHDLYRATIAVARRRRVSVNELVRECLTETTKAEEERRLFEAFGELGGDAEADAEYALAAQAEVLPDE